MVESSKLTPFLGGVMRDETFKSPVQSSEEDGTSYSNII